MKIALIALRSLMGVLFLFSSLTYLFKLITPPDPTGAMMIFKNGLDASVYLMPTVKVIELVCGIAFLSGRFVPLVALIIAPIVVNIFLTQAFLGPEGLPVAGFLVLANSFVAYSHWERYQPLFKR